MARRIEYMLSEAYNLGYDDGYKDGCEEAKEKFLDAYCKTCCRFERKKCLEVEGMCKQYARLVENLKT